MTAARRHLAWGLGLLAVLVPQPQTAAAQGRGDELRVAAAYNRGNVRGIPRQKRGTLDASGETALRFRWGEEQSWELPFARLDTVYILLSRQSVTESEVVGAPLGTHRKLLVSFRFANQQNRPRRAVFRVRGLLRQALLDRIQEKSGCKLVFESAEARRAVIRR